MTDTSSGIVPPTLAEAEAFLDAVKRIVGGASTFQNARWNTEGDAVIVRCHTSRGQLVIEQALRDHGHAVVRLGACTLKVPVQ